MSSELPSLKKKLPNSPKNLYHTLKPPFKSVVDAGFCDAKGHRPTMEDGHCLYDGFRNKDEGFFAVYDGHGGRAAVNYTEESLHTFFLEALGKGLNVRDSFVYAYKKTDFYLKEYDCVACGTTSATVFISTVVDKKHPKKKKRKLFSANCGDTRIVISRNGIAQRLSYDHTAKDEREKQRINATGGFILSNRVGATLSVARALGDHSLKKWVVCDPFYSEIDILPTDEFVIIACDGVWDVFSDQDAINLIKNEQNAQTMAELLVKKSISNGSTDNISVIVLFLNKRKLKKKGEKFKKKEKIKNKSKSQEFDDFIKGEMDEDEEDGEFEETSVLFSKK